MGSLSRALVAGSNAPMKRITPPLCTIPLLLASCSGGSSTSVTTPPIANTIPPGNYRVLGANDLGMHCMDREFSVFSILPPFNVVNAQVLYRTPSANPQLLDPTSAQVSYEGVADASGSINTHSAGKTDFWLHVQGLFGANLPVGMGLTGLYMPRDATPHGPQSMGWVTSASEFRAFGLPITPTDDAGAYKPFPLLRLRATNLAGTTLATTDVVVPVATETDCRNCHTTGGIAANLPGVNWSNDPDSELQAKWNVLILHDHQVGTHLVNQTPVLCAKCHYSPALDLAGTGNPFPDTLTGGSTSTGGHQRVDPLPMPKKMSTVMHSFHGHLTDAQGNPVFPPNGTAAQTCYQCHPGAITQCLRGAMATGGMECLNCHGDMLSTGGDFPLASGGSLDGTNDGHARRPWKDLPRCQSCHTGDAVAHLSGGVTVPAPDGIRLQQAWRTGDPAASAILATNTRFAENPSTLFRFSKGHGGVACEGCHGSTHAEWPNANAAANDNVAATQLQGHAGPIMECAACHANSLPTNLNGPHGMHPIGGNFIDGHGDYYEQHGSSSCKTCHGTNLLGTVLARAADDRHFTHDGHSYDLTKGQQVACNFCHSMP